jgi:hypothetical protein
MYPPCIRPAKLLAHHGKATAADVAAYVDELRAALESEWSGNHVERCGEWPHPEGDECFWPRPAVLDRVVPHDLKVVFLLDL